MLLGPQRCLPTPLKVLVRLLTEEGTELTLTAELTLMTKLLITRLVTVCPASLLAVPPRY